MNTFSVAGVGMYVTVISIGLRLLGINPPEGSVEAAVASAITIIGFVVWLVGQLKRKDLHFGLVRKY